MRTALFLALCLLAVPSAVGEEATGRVRAVYYEAARGVLVDRSMLRRPSAIRWVDVELDGQQRTLVQLPSHMDAKIGDVVAVELAGPKATQLAGFEPIRVSRVTAVRPSTQLAAPGN